MERGKNIREKAEPNRAGGATHLEHQGSQLEDGLAVHLDVPLLGERSVSRGEGAAGEAAPAAGPRSRPE